jgi:hypothetical protein
MACQSSITFFWDTLYEAIALFKMAAQNLPIFNDFYILTNEIILKQLVTSVSVIISVFTSPLYAARYLHTHR